jgi:hypothetical protein
MSVIFPGIPDYWYCPKPPVECSCCGEPTMPPFVHWNGTQDIFFCVECIRWIRSRLTADMARAVAIADGLACTPSPFDAARH